MHAISIFVLCVSLWRAAFAVFMSESDLQVALLKKVTELETNKVPVDQRSLAVYFLDHAHVENSPDVVENNVKLFASAVASHDETAEHRAVYIFCVVGGAKNPLSQHLPLTAPNALFISATSSHNDLLVHIHTITLLGDNIVSQFGSLLFLNQDSRGPFENRQHGKWWQRIVSVFRENPKVGIVGPMISCEINPHVQTHAFAMRPEIALDIFREFNPRHIAGKRNKNRHIETSFSEEAVKMGFDISSLFYQRQFNRTVFSGDCVHQEAVAFHRSNPTSWCNVSPQDALFLRFGGAPMRIKGYYCQETLSLVALATEKIALEEPALQLVLPETIYGGHLYPLHKEFNQEMWKDRSVQPLKAPLTPAVSADSKVCLLVRTFTMHGKAGHENARAIVYDVKQLVKSLLRQSNPHWEAFFFVTDDQPFDKELKNILRSFRDIRLNFINIDKKFRPSYTVRDAGYTATDEALRHVQKLPQCKWLSVTNGDNLYGSEVFNNILNTKPIPEINNMLPDFVLSPMDSRNFADQDYGRKRNALGVGDSWDRRCWPLQEELTRARYGYAMTPFPNLGGLDLAGLFMDRKKFVETGVYFNTFANETQYPCPGCQDGYFITDMVNKHNWHMQRAPIVGFNSLIFHGPSPLYCIASGNVWYDHPGLTVCLSHGQVGKLHSDDRYDWESFLELHGPRNCLRMSEKGYANMAEIIIK